VRKTFSFPGAPGFRTGADRSDHGQITPAGNYRECWFCREAWLNDGSPRRNRARVPGDNSWSIPVPNADALTRGSIPAQPSRASGGFPTLRNDPAQPPPGAGAPPRPVDFVAIQRSAEFTELRRRRTGFVLPATIGFMAWYLTYVLLAAYAPGFMATALFGRINVGLVLGVLQFASTVLITTWYTRFARGTLDPRVDAIRQHAGDPS
jgi:uncharacterized membrane protein (DUF485 family)